MTFEIQLSQGLVALIDEADMKKVEGLQFCATKGTSTWYAVSREVGPLHRFLMDAPTDMLVDHKDHNGLNNRRENLRICTQRQNGRNRKGAARKEGRTSRFLGVSWSKQARGWRAVIAAGPLMADGAASLIDIGRFANEEDAARAYDAAALLCFGEFASPNFPDSTVNLGLLKKRPIGEIERVSLNSFRLRFNGPAGHAERRLIGTFKTREAAEAARLALPENSDDNRLIDFAAYLQVLARIQ